MRIGMIGLGRMGAEGAATPEDLPGRLPEPRVVWLMVPPGVVDAAIGEFAPLLSRWESRYADKVLSAMRAAFGGHREKP